MASKISMLWNNYIEYVQKSASRLIPKLFSEHSRMFTEFMGEFSVTHENKVLKKVSNEHKTFVQTLRKIIQSKRLELLPISDIAIFGKRDEIPILIEDLYIRQEEISFSKPPIPIEDRLEKQRHLVILVHGYLGTGYDMEQIKSALMLANPMIEILISTVNEGSTEEDINLLGVNLANEVMNHISDSYSTGKIQHISFLGHSLGGIIIRAALPHLADLRPRMNTFITLATPHLGCMYQSSSLVNAGVWIMSKWKDSLCLKQLSLEETRDRQNTFLQNHKQSPPTNKQIRPIFPEQGK